MVAAGAGVHRDSLQRKGYRPAQSLTVVGRPTDPASPRSGSAFQDGDVIGAINELINIPANVTNASLNGAGLLDLTEVVKNIVPPASRCTHHFVRGEPGRQSVPGALQRLADQRQRIRRRSAPGTLFDVGPDKCCGWTRPNHRPAGRLGRIGDRRRSSWPRTSWLPADGDGSGNAESRRILRGPCPGRRRPG